MIIEPGSIIHDFRIKNLIGSGGMGEVYLAEELILERKVAIKVLNPQLTGDEQFRQRFVNEARIQGSLHHPNIVGLHSFFEQDGIYYMVQEFAPGRTLKDMITDEGPIPETRAIKILDQILKALVYAHAHDVIHRDIKPSNLMIDTDDRVKVMDFGIARIMSDSHLTKTGLKVGTLFYMSPEQILTPREVDHRTDIFSAGIVLYEMLTGRLPYNTDTDSDFAVQKEIVDNHLPDPRSTNPHISDHAVNLIRSLTQRDVANRPGIEDALKRLTTAATPSDASADKTNVPHSSNESISRNKDVLPPFKQDSFSKTSKKLGFVIPIIAFLFLLVYVGSGGTIFGWNPLLKKTDIVQPTDLAVVDTSTTPASIEKPAVVADNQVDSGFEDNFDDNINNWWVGINDAGFERSITGGRYILSNHSNNQAWSTGITLPNFDFSRNWKLTVRFGNRYNAFMDSLSNEANNFIFFAGDNSTWNAPKYRLHRYTGSYGHAARCNIQNLATGEGMTLYDNTEMNEPDYLVYTIQKRGDRLYFYYDGGTPFYYQAEQDYFPFSGSYGSSIGFGVYQNSQMIVDYIKLEYL